MTTGAIVKRFGGYALVVVAALMLYGFMRSGASIASAKTIVALLFTVVLPGAAGIALLGGFSGGARSKRLEQLRQQTIEAEILRLAMKERGRLTAVEVATALALSPETAKEALDALVTRDVADIAVSDEGVIVYTFHDAEHVAGKSAARGLLE
jgi:hypothetical protein